MMTGKEKVALALQHKTGPVPLDFGATATTGIHVSVVEKLREYYGLPKKIIAVAEPGQMLGVIDDDLARAIGVDTVPFWGDSNLYGFSNHACKEWKTPWGQTVLVPEEFYVQNGPGEYIYLFPCGDKNAEPCAKMPLSGYFFDTIIRQPVIDDDTLNYKDNLEEFGPVSEQNLQYYKEKLKKMDSSDRALIANFGGTALGDIALVPGPMLRQPKGIRDVEEWYVSTITRPEYIKQIFEEETLLALENLDKLYKTVGNQVQVAYICGTDLGAQNGPFCSPEQFRDLYLPYYQRVNEWIHTNTMWKTFKHCCGSILPLIDCLIEAGFDILNPVQWTARDMDARNLKKLFGHDLVFWGGGVDTQRTLPFGTPSEVREEVLETCSIFSENGGFVFNAIHNVQVNTPVENVIAMIDAVHEFN